MLKTILIVLFTTLILFSGVLPAAAKTDDKAAAGAGNETATGNDPGTESGTAAENVSMVVEKVQVTGEVSLAKTIQSVTVFPQDEINKYNPEGLKSILNRTAGYLTLSGGHYGQMAYSFARGAGTNQTLFLVDGFRVADPSNSLGLNLTFLAPELIEKAEIVRGPLSNMYGSNAMGGVVNLVSRNDEGMEAGAFLGSHGSYHANAYLSRDLGKNLNLSVNGSLVQYSDGINNDEFQSKGVTVKAQYRDNAFKAGILFMGNFAGSGIPFNYGLPTPNRQYTQDNFILALPIDYRWNEDSRIGLKLSHNANTYEFEDIDDVWLPYYVNESIVDEAQLTFATRLAGLLRLNGGIDVSSQKILNKDTFSTAIDNEKTAYTSAYLNAGIDLEKFLFSASIRYDKYRDIDAAVSPQVGFSYLVAGKLKIRGAYSQSFRAPTLPELLNPFWGNPGLEVEKSSAFEGGLEYYGRDVLLSAVYFNSHYTNLIGFSPLTYRFANLSKADIAGIEFSARLKLVKKIGLMLSYTYLDTHDFQYDRQLLRRPKHALGAMVSLDTKYFSISADMTYVGKRLDYNELTWSVDHSPAFDTFNINILVPVVQGLAIIASITNAFDAQYQEVMGYPAPSRRFQVGIKYTAGK